MSTKSESRSIVGASLLALAAALFLGFASVAQEATESPVQIRKLTLSAIDQPQLDLHAIAASLEGHAYAPTDLQARIQQKLRDEGFYFANVNPPKFDNAQNGSADASAQIQAGDQYTMGEITFKKAGQFSKDQMRSLFPLATGKAFNADAIQVGIDKLKGLYEAQGFADVGAVPAMAIDEEKKVIDISVEVEEGYPYLFGQLTIDGAEPTPGAGKALLTAWSQIAGKRYNPESLRKWLAANAPKSAPGAPAIHPRAEGIADTDAHLMNVRLIF